MDIEMENSNKMDATWWDAFIDQTNHLHDTTVIKDCLDSSETSAMRRNIMEIIADLAKLRTNKYGYRVYIEGRQLENNEMLRVYDCPPIKNENLDDWVSRAFGNQKFGMIINQGERFNLQLSQSIAKKLKPLLDKMGMPTEGIIFTLFIGNYDNTPLGIHLDSPGKSVMHFHLGPGSKKMYTWNTQKYEELVGEEKHNNQDIQRYLPYASEYAFDEGDIYFMPEDTYHVGTQSGLSIAIACWLNNRSNFDFALRLQSLFSEQYLKQSKDNLKFDSNTIDDITALDTTLRLFEIPPHLEQLSFKDLMKEIYRDLRYSLNSNGGFRTSPFPKTDSAYLKAEDKIQLVKPFKILYRQSLVDNKLYVFVRGIRFELNNYDCLIPFLDAVNNGEIWGVDALLDILDKDWDSNVGVYILSLLYKNHGILKVG